MSDLRIQKMQQNTGHLLGALQGKVKLTINGGKSHPPNKQINKAHEYRRSKSTEAKTNTFVTNKINLSCKTS